LLSSQISDLQFAQAWALDAIGNWPGSITVATGTVWAGPVHDRAGNRTTIPKPASLADGLSATHDAWNRLVEVKDGRRGFAPYEYDGLNRRIKSPLQYTSGSSPRSRRTACDSAIPCGRLFPAGGRSPDRSGKSAG
jgi:hypothetical protein